MLDWFEANPYGFSTIKSSGNGPVGNLDILPIRPNTLRRIVAGTLLERDVTGDCLYGASEKERIEDLYIESFAVDPACARSAPGIIIEVLSSFIDLVNRICNPGQVHRVYAIAASDEGSGLLARLGFESVGPSDGRRDGHQLYLGSMEVVAGAIYTLLGRRIVRTKSAPSYRSDLLYQTHPSHQAAVISAPSDEGAGFKPELASVLFMDIVAFTQLDPSQQVLARQELENCLQTTDAFKKAKADKIVVARPTGDGFALIFFAHPSIAAECAVEVARMLQSTRLFVVRMGINQGTVYRVKDINGHEDVTGSGINIAQRVMDCGEAEHILISASLADALRGTMNWPEFIRPIGRRKVKHGEFIEIYNLCGSNFGRLAEPKRKVRRPLRHSGIVEDNRLLDNAPRQDSN